MSFVTDIISATTISGTTLYGDGSNLTGIGGTFTYEIGQYIPSEGGVIGYRWLSNTSLGSPTTGTVQNYLVVDTSDLSLGAVWGLNGVDVTNCESTWDGSGNTISMINAGASIGTAAELCDSSTNNGKSDWYLPAIDELSLLYQNRWNITQGFENSGSSPLNLTSYWSSTEVSSNLAWYFSFSDGISTGTAGSPSGNKILSLNVRAVRKFSI